MMKIKNLKIVALIMALAMIMTAVPSTAFADDLFGFEASGFDDVTVPEEEDLYGESFDGIEVPFDEAMGDVVVDLFAEAEDGFDFSASEDGDDMEAPAFDLFDEPAVVYEDVLAASELPGSEADVVAGSIVFHFFGDKAEHKFDNGKLVVKDMDVTYKMKGDVEGSALHVATGFWFDEATDEQKEALKAAGYDLESDNAEKVAENYIRYADKEKFPTKDTEKVMFVQIDGKLYYSSMADVATDGTAVDGFFRLLNTHTECVWAETSRETIKRATCTEGGEDMVIFTCQIEGCAKGLADGAHRTFKELDEKGKVVLEDPAADDYELYDEKGNPVANTYEAPDSNVPKLHHDWSEAKDIDPIYSAGRKFVRLLKNSNYAKAEFDERICDEIEVVDVVNPQQKNDFRSSFLKSFNVKKNESGEFVLVDDVQDGYYVTGTIQVCQKCGLKKVIMKENKVASPSSLEVRATITDFKNFSVDGSDYPDVDGKYYEDPVSGNRISYTECWDDIFYEGLDVYRFDRLNEIITERTIEFVTDDQKDYWGVPRKCVDGTVLKEGTVIVTTKVTDSATGELLSSRKDVALFDCRPVNYDTIDYVNYVEKEPAYEVTYFDAAGKELRKEDFPVEEIHTHIVNAFLVPADGDEGEELPAQLQTKDVKKVVPLDPNNASHVQKYRMMDKDGVVLTSPRSDFNVVSIDGSWSCFETFPYFERLECCCDWNLHNICNKEFLLTAKKAEPNADHIYESEKALFGYTDTAGKFRKGIVDADTNKVKLNSYDDDMNMDNKDEEAGLIDTVTRLNEDFVNETGSTQKLVTISPVTAGATTDKNGLPIANAVDKYGRKIVVSTANTIPVVDEDGNPIKDAQGKPVFVKTAGKLIAVDEKGNVFFEDGEDCYVDKTGKVVKEALVAGYCKDTDVKLTLLCNVCHKATKERVVTVKGYADTLYRVNNAISNADNFKRAHSTHLNLWDDPNTHVTVETIEGEESTCIKQGFYTLKYTCQICGDTFEQRVDRPLATTHRLGEPFLEFEGDIVVDNIIQTNVGSVGSIYDAFQKKKAGEEVWYSYYNLTNGYDGGIIVTPTPDPDMEAVLSAPLRDSYLLVRPVAYRICQDCQLKVEDRKNLITVVDDVVMQKSGCDAGSITLTATLYDDVTKPLAERKVLLTKTATFPYWTSAQAYDGRDSHDWSDWTKVAGSETADGGYSETHTCAVCKKTETRVVEGNGHTHTNMTAVPAKDATCTEEGNIAYYVCECGKYFKDAEGTQEIDPASVKTTKDHTPGEAVVEDGYLVTYCTECKKELVRQLIPVTPTPAPTEEQIHDADKNAYHLALFQKALAEGDMSLVVPAKDPTCTENGNIAYAECPICHEKATMKDGVPTMVSDEEVIIAALGHTPGEAVQEGDDLVVYCTVCKKEVSRIRKPIEPPVDPITPGAVTIKKSTAHRLEGTVSLKYNAAENADHYVYGWKEAGSTGYTTKKTNYTTATASDLKEDVAYRLRVAAVSATGNKSAYDYSYRWMHAAKASLTRGKGKIKVVIKNAGNAGKFVIKWSKNPDMSGAQKVTVTDTTYMINGLERNATYYVRVCPYIKIDGKWYRGIQSKIREKVTK